MNIDELNNIDNDRLNKLLESNSLVDILKFNLHIPIEDVSGGGCTPDGILKKTAGMDTQTLRKKYPMM